MTQIYCTYKKNNDFHSYAFVLNYTYGLDNLHICAFTFYHRTFLDAGL